MKLTKTQIAFHAVLAAILTIIYSAALKLNLDSRVNIIYVCGLITLINTLIICAYVNDKQNKNSAIMDFSLFYPPIGAILLISFVVIKAPFFITDKIGGYLAAAIILGSILLQLLLTRGRKSNIEQENTIATDRMNREEIANDWRKIVSRTGNNPEVNKAAKKVETEITYSDPVSLPEVSGMEKEIAMKTKKLKVEIEEGNYNSNTVLNEIDEVLSLITDRNSKLKMLK